METLEEALKNIEIVKARAILNEAKSGNFMDGDIPEDPDEIVKEAMYWYEEAFKAHEAGMRHDTVHAILGIGNDDTVILNAVPDGYRAQDLRDKPVENAVKDESPEPPETPQAHQGDPLGAVGAIGPPGVINPVAKHNLPVPKDWEGDPEDFPRDISELTDKDVRRLSGEYNAYLSRAKWLLALAIHDLASTTHLRDHYYRLALKKTVKVDPKTEKTKLKEVIEAEAREDETFAAYDEAALKHQGDVTILKSLVDIYSGNVDRLSREWTMRQDEYEKTR